MPTSFESEHASNNNRGPVLARFMHVSKDIVRFVFNYPMLEKKWAAEELEKLAEEYADFDVGISVKYFLKAGKKYIEGGRLDDGQKTLERALSPLEEYARTGKLDSYECYIDGLENLGAVYKQRGALDRAELVQAKALALTAEMEELYFPKDT